LYFRNLTTQFTEQFPLHENKDVPLDEGLDSEAQIHKSSLTAAAERHLLIMVTQLLKKEGLKSEWIGNSFVDVYDLE
jgi:hypothetical protein